MNEKGPTWAASGKNLAALYAQPYQVLMVGKIPAGFVLFDYELEYGLGSKESRNYTATYLKDSGHWFRIESTDITGDAPWEDSKVTEFKSKLFGKVTIQTSRASSGEILRTSRLISDWLPCPGADADRKKWPDTCRSYHVFGRGITPKQAMDVIESLTKRN